MRVRLSLDVEYDPEVTDPENLASALDCLLETATSTSGILSDHGDPTLGSFEVDN